VDIGDNIKKYRKRVGLSREKLVLKSHGLFSASHLLSIEKGRTKNPGIDIIVGIADALGLSVDELIGRRKPKSSKSAPDR
jgi:transcriptional regulator with XRE-family HTH domain